MSSHLDYRGIFFQRKASIPQELLKPVSAQLAEGTHCSVAIYLWLVYHRPPCQSPGLSSPQLLTLLITCYSIPYYSDSVRVSVSVSLSSILSLLLSHCLYCSLLLSCFPNSGHVQPAAAMFITFSLYSLIFTIETLTISWSNHVMSAVLLLLFCLLPPLPILFPFSFETVSH